MSVRIDDYENEFLGEISKFCIDGEHIWFYDEVSGGLYRLDKKSYVVELILTPMDIHQKKIFPLRQIIKWKNEIYLIPDNISYEWLIYNIVDKRLRRVFLTSQSYVIGNVLNIGKWIYLIPEKTNHILAIIEADTLNINIIISNWYKNDVAELACWGNSVFEDTILFPIINTREIYQIQKKQIVELSLHINQPIYSVSLAKNGIWILPSKGNTIFFVDKKGELIDSIEIRINNGYVETADRFVRIIASKRYVYLFPRQGGQILILDSFSKEWITVGEKNEPLYRPLYQKTKNFPYWGCCFNEGKLCTLPLQYRFAEINIESKSIDYKILRCITTFMRSQYISWVHWINEKAQTYMYVEWERDSLKNFLETQSKNSIVRNVKLIGKNIWMIIDQSYGNSVRIDEYNADYNSL